jgi:hypothetical protein
MRKIILFLALLLLLPIGYIRSEDKSPLWKSGRFKILSTYKQSMLIGYVNGYASNNKYDRIDLVDKVSGKSLWNSDNNDICKFLKNRIDVYRIFTKLNLVILSYYDYYQELVKTRCFDMLTGSLLWSNNEISTFVRETNVVYVKDDVVYATYFKKTKNPIIKLLEFDIYKGTIISSKEMRLVYDCQDISSNDVCHFPLIIGYINDKIYIDYSNKLQCYDLYNQKLLWAIEKTWYMYEVLFNNNVIVVSSLEDYECGLTNVYRFINPFTGKQVYETSGYKTILIRNDIMYFQQCPCPHNIDIVKKEFLTKLDINEFKILKEISIKSYFSNYTSNFILTTQRNINSKNDAGFEFIVSIFDYDLKHIETITKKSNAEFIDLDATDDIYTISYSTKNGSISITEVYTLPDFEYYEKKSFLDLVKWFINYIFKKIFYP